MIVNIRISRFEISRYFVKCFFRQWKSGLIKVLSNMEENEKTFYNSMAFQELEWHANDDVNFDGVKNDISEITHGVEALYLTVYSLFGPMHKT